MNDAKLILPGQAEIIKPGAQPISPAQKKLEAMSKAYAALWGDLSRLAAVHQKLIEWCGANLTEEQMQDVLRATGAKAPH